MTTKKTKEYDFSKGRRGTYAASFAAGTNLVVLDPDVARAFPDSARVNEALRRLLKASNRKKR
jgi:hypothetical protein